MDTQKFTGKQLLIIVGIGVLVQVVGGFILYQLTKPKTTDPTTPSPSASNLGTTQTPTVTTVPTSATTVTQG